MAELQRVMDNVGEAILQKMLVGERQEVHTKNDMHLVMEV